MRVARYSKSHDPRVLLIFPSLLTPFVAATEFVDFVDSRGLFGCRIPKNFLRAERPKDKRGIVFVAGDYSKAEVMSVQMLTAFDLLTDAGEQAVPVTGGNVARCRRPK